MSDSCTTLREALLDRADGRLTAQSAALEAHLSTCGACRALADRLGGPLALGRVEVPAPVLSEMRADLHRRLDELQPPGLLAWLFAGSFSIPKPFAWALAAALLLWTAHVPRARPPAPSPILMDGVDRLALSGDSAES